MVQQLEKNVIYSFNLAKKDILKLQNDIVLITDNQHRIIKSIEELRKEMEELNRKSVALTLKVDGKKIDESWKEEIDDLKKRVSILSHKLNEKNPIIVKTIPKIHKITKTVVKKSPSKKKIFVASKTGKKFHLPNCVFTKNIKPKMMVKFKTKNKAMNKGYKPCDCVKR